MAISMATASQVAHGAVAFLDDFEDGNHDGWVLTESGAGSTGVSFNNESMRAFVSQTSSGGRSLSQDFDYHPTHTVSFEMQAQAFQDGSRHANSGVNISFLTAFNVPLGSVDFMVATHDSWYTANSHRIDNTVNDFSGTMSQWAEFANVDPNDPVATMTVKFFGNAASGFGDASQGIVRFDNVQIEPVPLPASIWFLGSTVAWLGWRRKCRRVR